MFDRLMSTADRESRKHRNSRTAAELEDLAWEHVRESDPVRISHAQRILGVSNQTVRSWIDEGSSMALVGRRGGSDLRVW
jgi:DNA-binding transcriptional regulator YiaG